MTRSTVPFLTHTDTYAISVKAFLLLFAMAFTPLAKAELVWHWQDPFDAADKQKLTKWIDRTVTAVEQQVGPYPFDVHIYFYRRAGRGQPVPWANTRRGRVQGVNFYVDPSFSLQDFLRDWTAPHELSHLLIPYLGRRNAWFAEGFASFMQYQVMQQMGVLTEEQALARYRVRIEKAAREYRESTQPFALAAPKLQRRRQYPTMYWGGAVYFLQADRLLRQRDDSLQRVLARYTTCCRTQTRGLDQLVAQLDRISTSTLFSNLLRDNRSQQGFPRFQNLFPATETAQF
ncbi:gluzincin family metallopeptidase [Microbulbifer sp. 2201CG32-9]|uniref:hypothetical protein n=1 Tax=Microbulbifer sp. 2201CG32-9 TaxID=3232309 RepID=UPI00345B67CC